MRTGIAIREIRKKKGIKQKELAAGTGLSQTFISLIEQGYREPSSATLRSIARILECPTPIIHWKAMEESDVPREKRKIYTEIKEVIDRLLETML